MKPVVTIIIPTFNNPTYLDPCLYSIRRNGVLNGFGEVVVINNGDQPIQESDGVRVIKAERNLGWEGGLKLGLQYSDSPFVCFQNDDTFIPQTERIFYQRLLIPFQDQKVAITGPITTVASGLQCVFQPATPLFYVNVKWLIFFCAMIRRSALDEVGGVDDSLPGGDDFDLSIRVRKAGYKLRIAPDCFILHHGFKTGERVRGDWRVSGGWNSQEMQESTNNALIKKHGFKEFFTTMSNQFDGAVSGDDSDPELKLIRSYVNGDKVLELGCGPRKMVDSSVGVDIIPKGFPIINLDGRTCVADVVADASLPLPFDEGYFDTIIASHLLEHCLDTVQTITNWKKILKIGGRLIIAVPNEAVTSGIPMNPEHCHAYNMESLIRLMSLLGFKLIDAEDSRNGVSFVACFEKAPILAALEVAP